MLRLVIWPSMMLFGWTETKLCTLKYGSKSIQMSLSLRQHPSKSYKLLNFFMISVILFKMSKHSDFHLIFFQVEGAWHFLKIRDVCMDFELYFKVHNLVSVCPKSIILGQMTNLNTIFHVVVSVYWLVKIWNSSQFPDEFRNGQFFDSDLFPKEAGVIMGLCLLQW